MRVSSLQVVVTFAVNPGIIFSSGKQLMDLKSALGAKLLSLNVPESAPPETPRAMLSTEDMIIGLGFNRLDITTRPPDHVNQDYAACATFAERKAHPIIESLGKQVEYLWAGIVVMDEYVFPKQNAPSLKVVTPVFDRLVNIPREAKDLASFQLQYGYKQGDFYKNFTISGFETRDVSLEIQLKGAGPIRVDLSKYPITESGIQISVDINNKASSSESDVLTDIARLFQEQIATHSGLMKELNLEGLLP